MQRWALLVVVIGIVFLASFIELSSPLTIKSKEDINKLLENQKVYTSGIVIKETQTSVNRILVLDNNITIYCECSSIPKLIDKQVAIL